MCRHNFVGDNYTLCKYVMKILFPAIYLTLGTYKSDFNSYMHFQGGTAAMQKLPKQTIEHF